MPKTVDGDPDYTPAVYAPRRSDFILEQQRISSGGLSDDPTESGAPVRNPKPYKGLRGGRNNAKPPTNS